MEVATRKMEEMVSLVQAYVEALAVTADSKKCYILQLSVCLQSELFKVLLMVTIQTHTTTRNKGNREMIKQNKQTNSVALILQVNYIG
jgi:hypothetical protein